jgi:hypothetical protein
VPYFLWLLTPLERDCSGIRGHFAADNRNIPDSSGAG